MEEMRRRDIKVMGVELIGEEKEEKEKKIENIGRVKRLGRMKIIDDIQKEKMNKRFERNLKIEDLEGVER